MKGSKTPKKIMKAFVLLMPFGLILSAVYVLEYFGRKRMGMMRYLVFIKREFENGWFQPEVNFSLGALVSILICYLLWKLFKEKPRQQNILVYWLSSLLVLNLWLILPQTRALKSYHFGLIGWLVLGAIVTLYSLWQLVQKKY